MDDEGKECREEDGRPVFGGFVTENIDGNKKQQQESGTMPSGRTDSVPSPVKEPNLCTDWKIPLEQVEAILQPSLSAAEARVTLMMQQFVESIESQILSALKQAAMDIIEHLGKEAAMRVLDAERKAAIFEQEMINIKQEALTMLVRLKQSMDAQIIEAERACQIERSRAQEMEAKLMTAQDMVKKLRNELKRKGEVLETMKKIAQPLDEHRVVQMHSPTEYSTMQVTSSTRQLPEQILIEKPYLPSIVTKSKEKTIPTNGCNNGIYGETINETIAGALPSSDGIESKDCLSTENDLLAYSAEKRHIGCEATHQGQTFMPDVNSFQTQNARGFLCQSALLVTCTGKSGSGDGCSVHTEGKPSPSSESDASLGTEDKSVATDKSTLRVGDVEMQEDMDSHPEICNASFLPQDREAKTWASESSKTSDGDEKPASSGMENLHRLSEDKDADVVRPLCSSHVKEKKSLKDDCRTSSRILDGVITVQSTLCSSLAKSSLENGGLILNTAGKRVADEGGVITRTNESDDEKTRLSVHSDITRQDCDKSIIIGKPFSIEDSKSSPDQMNDIDAGQCSEIKICGSAIDQRAHSRPTKFTFQRKRRRESPFQQNINLVQEEKDPKREETKQHEYFPVALSGKLPQKHRTTTLVSHKSSLVAESSRESRRLMQGARQLVSLSEKKSW